jgi:hypothetical protein
MAQYVGMQSDVLVARQSGIRLMGDRLQSGIHVLTRQTVSFDRAEERSGLTASLAVQVFVQRVPCLSRQEHGARDLPSLPPHIREVFVVVLVEVEAQ